MATLGAVTFDCVNALHQARFWAAALEWDVAPDAGEHFAVIGGPRRPPDAPNLLFLQVPEGKVAKNRNHVDLHTEALDTELQRLLELGATVIHEKNEFDTHWYTLSDPEGNEFCLVEDAPSTPAG